MRWEVLSAKLEQDHPDGVRCIQAALNDPAHAAMLVHEMQILKQLAEACTAECDVAGHVCLETVKARLVAEGLPCATSSSFLPLLHFVAEQGGNRKHGFVQSLVDFHQLFVNPRIRRLRESHFRVVYALPLPRLRLVLLKVAYGCPASALRDGWIDYFGAQHMNKIQTKHVDAMVLADKVAARFHSDYGHAGVWKEPGSARLLHAFDIELGRVLLCKEGYQGSVAEVASTAGIFDAKVRAMRPVALAAKLGDPFPVAAVLRGSKGKHEELGPTLADFIAEGVPVQASTKVAAAAAAPIPWVHDVNGSAHVAAAHGRVLATLALMAKHLNLPFLM